MKRSIPWKDEANDSSSDESSSSHTDSDADDVSGKKNPSFQTKPKEKDTQSKSGKRKSAAVDFDALQRYGYRGGPSILNVPPPKENEKQDWSWSNGKETREKREIEESYEERLKTRDALNNGEQLSNVMTQKERKNFSFSQKEKRKRELGQASRGKNYVEEEKRMLRESGIYSGFDT